jgi:hypothetical protein
MKDLLPLFSLFPQRGLNTKRPKLVFFLAPTEPYMDRLARTGDTVLDNGTVS